MNSPDVVMYKEHAAPEDYVMVPSTMYNIAVDDFGNAVVRNEETGEWDPAHIYHRKAENWKTVVRYKVKGKRKDLTLARLVYEVWGEDFDPNKRILHIDGDLTNNHIENLRQGN